MWALLKQWKRIFPSKLESFLIVYKAVDFISEIISMFGFVTKFKADVIAGFDSVHQRLVTLEAKVEALFNHTKTVAEASPVVATVTTAVEGAVSMVETGVANAASEAATKATAVEAVASDVAKTVEDTKGAA
jgi:hypothetical protein